MPSKLRRLTTAKGLTPYELELINKNWDDIEVALDSVGAATPGSVATPIGGVTDHGLLTGLSDDDHAQYLLLAGRASTQTLLKIIADANTPAYTVKSNRSVTDPHSLIDFRDLTDRFIAQIGITSSSTISIDGPAITLGPTDGGADPLIISITAGGGSATSGLIRPATKLAYLLDSVNRHVFMDTTVPFGSFGGILRIKRFSKLVTSGLDNSALIEGYSFGDELVLSSNNSNHPISLLGKKHLFLTKENFSSSPYTYTPLGIFTFENNRSSVPDTTSPTVVFKGIAAQTGDLLQLRNSADTTLVKSDKDGKITIAPASTGRALSILAEDFYHSANGGNYEIKPNSAFIDVLSSVRFSFANDVLAPNFVGNLTGNVNTLTTNGDLLTRAAGAQTRLPIGSSGQVLTVSGGQPTWAVHEAIKVGGLYFTVAETTGAAVAAALGYGTWSLFGAGRVIVCVDSGDTDFDSVEETGGAKTVASAGTVDAIAASATAALEVSAGTANFVTVDGHTHPAPAYTGTATSVQQKYITAYVWKRTA